MSLVQRCFSEFPAKIRSRGETYASLGLVDINVRQSRRVEAEVLGSKRQVYRVGVGWDHRGHSLDVWCTCPGYADRGPCKHLWATLKVLDSQYPDMIPGSRPIQVRSAAVGEGQGDDADTSNDPPAWRQALAEVGWKVGPSDPGRERVAPEEVYFTIDTRQSQRSGHLMVLFQRRRTKSDGTLGQPKALELSRDAGEITDGELRRTILQLIGCGPPAYQAGFDGEGRVTACEIVDPLAMAAPLRALCETGRFYRLDARGNERTVTWDGDEPWGVALEVQDGGQHWRIEGVLERGRSRRPVEEPEEVLRCGVLVFIDRLALCGARDVPWVTMLRDEGSLRVPKTDEAGLLDTWWEMPNRPPIRFPPELDWPKQKKAPTPKLSLWPEFSRGRDVLCGRVGFLYGDTEIARDEPRSGVVDPEHRIVLERHSEEERGRWNEVLHVGLKERNAASVFETPGELELVPSKLGEVVESLLRTGWQIVSDGVRYRAAKELQVNVEDGIDWFDIQGGIDFDTEHVTLPRLLEAVQEERTFVDLPDGSKGLLPKELRRDLKTIAALGEVHGDSVRFQNNQASLLDVLLTEHSGAVLDPGFKELRSRLRTAQAPTPKAAPEPFKGSLRMYQQESLGWMQHLRNLNLNGCLADDMGLGKTVQVIALLTERHHTVPVSSRKPHLVVMPSSLIFNWQQEAAKFAPHLKVVRFGGPNRNLQEALEADVILTTYGVLRRDIEALREVAFDYVVLDEAQAIKNENSEVSKAARLLNSVHRLALSGTPVENRLAELGSILGFLNPGIFGSHAAARELFKNDDALELIATGVRPLILRRTKEQVLDELPPKTELTLYCEMSDEQRELYDELRDHYRGLLTARVDTQGIERSQMQVLQALLRLRQAACHPGLVDEKFSHVPSGKLQLLFEQIASVVAEGHKGLVFSQFTQLLGLVRAHLEREGIGYAYLDGKTQRREEPVTKFQQDPDCKMFLISLKAGGVGLNLVAASYVFILDPWWNPAAEAQAVDRAHRMGQKERVFAYRLVSRDSVEEKILMLQAHKKRLADAIVTADNSVLSKLTPEDLELLLG